MLDAGLLRVAFDSTVSARAATGVSAYAHELLHVLRERPLEIREWRRDMGAPGAPFGRFANGLRLASWFVREVDSRAEREDIDVYHATTSLGPIRVRKPVVMTVHDQTPVTMPIQRGIPDRVFQRWFSVGAARRADAILSPTLIAADAVAEAYRVPRSKVHVVPLGVADAFREVTAADVVATRTRRGLLYPYVLFVGAEPPRKNLPRLMQAFAAVAARHKDLHLVFAGPERPRDHSLGGLAERLGVGGRFHRLGDVTREELPAIYAGATCLAMVSLIEGFGLTIAEAMAAGTPVVTSNRSSMPEVAGGAALLVDPTSVDEIAGGLERALCDSELADDMRKRGRFRSEEFTWRRTAELTERVYREVAGR